MSGGNGGEEKTEKPTAQRLREARKKGDVAKSKDVTSAFVLFVALLLLLLAGNAATRVALLSERVLAAVARPSEFAMSTAAIGREAAWVGAVLSIIVVWVAAIAAGVAEFAQVGALLTMEKLKPSLAKLNPVDGLKRMFGMDNLAELLKTLIKTLIIGSAASLVIWLAIADLTNSVIRTVLPLAPRVGTGYALAIVKQHVDLVARLVQWSLTAFLAVAIGDVLWQRHRFIKKLRMSRRDIRQEFKQQEGDPLIRSSRRELHQQWANQNVVGAARSASVLVVNPTHVAIAIDYDPVRCPVPRVIGKGVDGVALEMRRAAGDAGVPIVRSVALARRLLDRVVVDAYIPVDLFDAMAAIIILLRKQPGALGARS